MRRFAFALALAVVVSPAVAKDKFPYKEDGPKRNWYLQTTIRVCTRDPYWSRLGSDQEVLDFCNCKALYLADVTTDQDISDQYKAQAAHTKVPAELTDKWQTAYTACQGKFTNLPPVPERGK